MNLHLYSFHLYTPGISSFVKTRLHDMGNGLTLGEDFSQILCSEHIAERGSRQKSSRMAREDKRVSISYQDALVV